MKKIVLLIVLAVAATATTWAKKSPAQQSYNLQRGIEAADNEDFEGAMKYLLEETGPSSTNGEAFVWAAYCRLEQEKYGLALNNATRAIRFLPKKDIDNLAWAYSLRSTTNLNLKDTVAAINDISMAIKIDPQYYRWWERRGYIYYLLNRFDEAIADYQKSVEQYPGRAHSSFMIGRCLQEESLYNEAIEIYNRVILLDATYVQALGHRAICFAKTGDQEKATDEIIRALNLDIYQDEARDCIKLLSAEGKTILRNKLEAKSIAHPKSFGWHLNLAVLLEKEEQYMEAIAEYKAAKSINSLAWLDDEIADCYQKIPDYEHALKYINRAIESNDSYNYFLWDHRAGILFSMGRFQEALEDHQTNIKAYPEHAPIYNKKGKCLFFLGQYKEADKAFKQAAIFSPEWNYPILWRAITQLQLGDTIQANQLFEKVIARDHTSLKAIALAYLGHTDEAVKAFQDYKEKHPEESDYDLACVYSISGDTLKAVNIIETLLRDGYKSTYWMKQDYDLRNIHANTRFLQLIDSVEAIFAEQVKNNSIIEGELKASSDSVEQVVVEVPFQNVGGITKVSCSINELPLSFVFDTGCSDVTISQVEANFMFKNGYLEKNDILGRQSFTTADGSISVGTIINLRHINFGGLELTDVRASVVASQKAPLLLGQSVLQRLGKIEIDNEARILRITTFK